MAEIHALSFTKAQLDLIPTDERLFYFMAGQILNDINILTKILIFAVNELTLSSTEGPERSAAKAQVVLILKLLAGRLYEGHKTISSTFSAKGFYKKYAADMSSDSVTELHKINKYFGSKNAIQRIRTLSLPSI
jgi:hypothetical protein